MTSASPRSPRVRRFFRSLVIFAACFILFQVLYRSIPEGMDVALNQNLNAAPAAWILDLVLPGQEVTAREATVAGARASVNIRKGCEGFEVMGILIAAMLAYPMSWRLRAIGLAVGVLYVYILNLLRIIGIFLTHAYKPEWAEAAHVTAGQTFIILLVVLFIFLWIEWVVGDSEAGAVVAGDAAGG